MDESRLDESRVGRIQGWTKTALDVNRLDEYRLDENELDEKWVYRTVYIDGLDPVTFGLNVDALWP